MTIARFNRPTVTPPVESVDIIGLSPVVFLAILKSMGRANRADTGLDFDPYTKGFVALYYELTRQAREAGLF